MLRGARRVVAPHTKKASPFKGEGAERSEADEGAHGEAPLVKGGWPEGPGGFRPQMNAPSSVTASGRATFPPGGRYSRGDSVLRGRNAPQNSPCGRETPLAGAEAGGRGAILRLCYISPRAVDFPKCL